jgi:triacylglycerol lipase
MNSMAGQYHIDTQRLAVYGYSAGGHLAALLATDRATDAPPLRAAVVGGAPCDLSFIPEESRAIAHVLGGTRGEMPRVYREASPLSYASCDDCPMFFFHGDCDWIVPPTASRVLCERLHDLGVETCYYSVEKQGHLLTFIHPDARRAAIDFLNKHLQQGH